MVVCVSSEFSDSLVTDDYLMPTQLCDLYLNSYGASPVSIVDSAFGIASGKQSCGRLSPDADATTITQIPW